MNAAARPLAGLARKLALSAGVLVLVAVCAEVGLRLAGYDPTGPATLARDATRGTILRTTPDPRRRYELTPGAVGARDEIEISINSLGMRDREYSREKPPGTRRIVVLGDSVTFGEGLSVEATFPERLEERLAHREEPVEVLNMGVTGYDLMQEVAWLEAGGLELDPDLLVVGFCLNDAGTQSVTIASLERVERYRPWRTWSRLGLWLALRVDRLRIDRGELDLNEERTSAQVTATSSPT